MKRYLCIALLVGWAAIAAGQESGGQAPSNFRLLNASGNRLDFNFDTGRIDGIHGGAELELIPVDPASPPMRIKGNDITFKYAEGSEEPEVLVLTGNVNVTHPKGTIVAEKGEWNRRSGNLVFQGSPAVFKLKDGGDLTAPKLSYNMETGQVSAEGGFQIKNMPLAGMGGVAGGKQDQSPFLLTTKDVKDWPALLGGVKRQAAGDAPSPGKQILAQFDPKLRTQFNNVVDNKAPNAPTQGELVKALNRALRSKTLYNADAWKGIEVGPDAQALLKKGNLSSEEVMQLNRRLIEAAYPGAIVPRA